MKKKLLIYLAIINTVGIIGTFIYLDAIYTIEKEVQKDLHFIRINHAWDSLFRK